MNVAGSNVITYRRPPQTGGEIGLLKDDAGNTITDESSMTIDAEGESVTVDRVQFLVSSGRVELRESTSLHFGSFVQNTLARPQLTLQIGAVSNTIDYDRGFSTKAYP